MKGFDLLAQIYKLLADADLRAVHEARQSAGEGPVGQILDAMASALAAKPIRVVGRTSAARPQAPATTDKAAAASRNGSPQSLLFVMKGPKRKTDELIRLLRKSGLPVPVKPKDGTIRAIGRAEKLLSRMSAEDADRTVRRLRALLGIDETQGWIDVIRDSHE